MSFIHDVHVNFNLYRRYDLYFQADFLLYKATGCRDTEVCQGISQLGFCNTVRLLQQYFDCYLSVTQMLCDKTARIVRILPKKMAKYFK